MEQTHIQKQSHLIICIDVHFPSMIHKLLHLCGLKTKYFKGKTNNIFCNRSDYMHTCMKLQ